MKLYQEEEKPVDAIAFIRKQLCGDLPDQEEIAAMREEITKLKMEKEKMEQEKLISLPEVQKTDSEIENVLTKKFKGFTSDNTGSSLLKDYLNEDVFESLMESKTDPFEGSLLDNIQSGLTHFDSEIGIFASDQNAYETFEELFKPVLEDLHDTEVTTGEGEAATTVSAVQPAINWGETDDLKELDPEGSFIKNISITIGRGVDGIPFAPIMNTDHLQENAFNFKKILNAIDDDEMKGKYYELVDIDDEKRAKWIQEEILFPEPEDKFLKAAGTYNLWPVGRGLFLNEKNNYSVWVNYEEHLQITSFDLGCNLREVYQRLVKITRKFDEINFARAERWGFLAHNLKNIGNTMRISVKAKLPQMIKDENKEKFEYLCEQSQLTYKDLGDGIVQLTNSKRMGISEIETVKGFQKAIEDVINAEKCATAP